MNGLFNTDLAKMVSNCLQLASRYTLDDDLYQQYKQEFITAKATMRPAPVDICFMYTYETAKGLPKLSVQAFLYNLALAVLYPSRADPMYVHLVKRLEAEMSKPRVRIGLDWFLKLNNSGRGKGTKRAEYGGGKV